MARPAAVVSREFLELAREYDTDDVRTGVLPVKVRAEPMAGTKRTGTASSDEPRESLDVVEDVDVGEDTGISPFV